MENPTSSQRDERLRLPSMASTSFQLVEPGVRYLHALGPRAVAEFLLELTEPVGEVGLLLRQLDEYRLLTPDVLRATGGDRFPRRIYLVAGGCTR